MRRYEILLTDEEYADLQQALYIAKREVRRYHGMCNMPRDKEEKRMWWHKFLSIGNTQKILENARRESNDRC